MSRPVLFFDGVCGLCNKSVTFLFNIDRRHRLKFAPLQGETAKKILGENLTDSMESLILFDGSRFFYASDSVLESFRIIGGVWRWLWLFRIVPRPIRDFLYFQIATRRYKIFGKLDQCRIPSPEEREYFLD